MIKETSSSADEDGLYCQARTSPSIICQGNTYSCAFVGVSDSHQIQDLGSLLKETSSSVEGDGLY